jgi:hypothetical protein
MHYQEYYTGPSLRPFVRVIWSMENDTALFDAPPMRILPDTCVELVVHFADPYKTTYSSNTSTIQQQSLIVAQIKNFIEIQPHGKIGLIAVRFSAWSAYFFLGIPVKGERGCHWRNRATVCVERHSSSGGCISIEDLSY